MDVDLSSNEDSVSSLAVAQSDENSAVVFAGINSSIEEQKQGRNDHLRSFVLQYPGQQRKSADGRTVEIPDTPGRALTEALCKSPLFTPDTRPEPETYQRVLRLSRPSTEHNRRLGAAATGLAPIGEVTVFDASKSKVDQSDVRQRINLGKNQEAADVDIIEANDYEYYVAYCTDYDIYLCKVPFDRSAAVRSPYLLYETPFGDTFTKEKRRPQFRSLRFLTPRLLLVLLNRPQRSGAELLLLEISENPLLGTIALRKSLHKGIRSATSLSVALLPASDPSQNIQHVIAIAGQDISLTVLTLDHNPRSRSSYSLRQYALFNNLHPIQMTSLAFSYFNPPSDPVTATPQYLKLASTSMSNTVVVHTLPLVPTPSPVAKRKPNDPPTRYVLQKPQGAGSEAGQLGLAALGAIIMVALGAFMLQAIIEIRGGGPEYIGAKTWLSKPLRDKIALPYMFADMQVPVITDSLPPVESPLKKAYKVVEESLPSDTEEARESAHDTAEKIKHATKHSHRRVRDLLRRRLAILEAASNDEDEDVEDPDIDMPLFSQVFGDEVSESYSDSDNTPAHGRDTEPPRTPTLVIRAHAPEDEDESHRLVPEAYKSEEHLRSHESGGVSVKKWEDLKPHEKRSWTKRLEEAGVWTLQEGEGILKGVFFSEVAGVVAGIARGGI